MQSYISKAKLVDDETGSVIEVTKDFIVRAENDDDAALQAASRAENELFTVCGSSVEVTVEEADAVQPWIFNGKTVRFSKNGELI